MKVRVKLIATYRAHLPPGTNGNKVEVEVPVGTTASDVMAQFNIPRDETSVILVNGLTVPLSTVLAEGDEVAAFSAVAGGSCDSCAFAGTAASATIMAITVISFI